MVWAGARGGQCNYPRGSELSCYPNTQHSISLCLPSLGLRSASSRLFGSDRVIFQQARLTWVKLSPLLRVHYVLTESTADSPGGHRVYLPGTDHQGGMDLSPAKVPQHCSPYGDFLEELTGICSGLQGGWVVLALPGLHPGHLVAITQGHACPLQSFLQVAAARGQSGN